MLSQERYNLILILIKEQKYVKVSELTKRFGVSLETVRRDLYFLESQGLIKRIHGGATGLESAREFQDLSHRIGEQSEKKKKLAEFAASLIQEKDIIAIDYGSTAIELAKVIRSKIQALTVVTNSLSVFEILNGLSYNLILTGGQYYKSENAFYGTMVEDALKNLHVNKSFISPSGISLKYGVTDYLAEFIPIQKIYLEIADKSVIMADSSKFEAAAFEKICSITPDQVYVTDDDLEDRVYELFLENTVNLFRSNKKNNA